MTSPRRRIRILRVIARMNMGGPAYHVSLLGGLLDPRRYETLLVTGQVGRGEASLVDLAGEYGVQPLVLDHLRPELDPLADARVLRSLGGIVRSFRPDIVHTHTAKAGFIGRTAALVVRPRPIVIHTFHGHVLESYFGPVRSGSYRLIERTLARVTDRLLGVSQATVDDLVRLGVAPASRFRVVPVGLRLDAFLALDPKPGGTLREELGAAEGDLLLVYAGRLAPIKRLDVALQAVALARRRGAQVMLLVVGDGELHADLERLAHHLEIADVVHFLGYRRDLPTIVAAADAGFLSSDNEGTPISLIEAAAAARPLVATEVGGVADVVVEGAGLMAPAGDVGGLADGILRLASDVELRRAMGGRGREHVRSRFDAHRLIRDIESLYGELLAARR